MSDTKSLVVLKKDAKSTLNELLRFGPEDSKHNSDSNTQRILQIVRKLKEISDRIDSLSTRLY